MVAAPHLVDVMRSILNLRLRDGDLGRVKLAESNQILIRVSDTCYLSWLLTAPRFSTGRGHHRGLLQVVLGRTLASLSLGLCLRITVRVPTIHQVLPELCSRGYLILVLIGKLASSNRLLLMINSELCSCRHLLLGKACSHETTKHF